MSGQVGESGPPQQGHLCRLSFQPQKRRSQLISLTICCQTIALFDFLSLQVEENVVRNHTRYSLCDQGLLPSWTPPGAWEGCWGLAPAAAGPGQPARASPGMVPRRKANYPD